MNKSAKILYSSIPFLLVFTLFLLIPSSSSQEEGLDITRDRFSITTCDGNICNQIISLSSLNYYAGSSWKPINITLTKEEFTKFGHDYNYSVTSGVYKAYFKRNFSYPREVLFTKDNHYLGLEISGLYWADEDNRQLISQKQSSLATRSNNRITYPDAFGENISVAYFYTPDTLQKKVRIGAKNNLPPPDNNVKDGQYPSLRVVYKIKFSDNITISVDGQTWNKQDTKITNGKVVFSDKNTGEIIHFLNRPYAIDKNGIIKEGWLQLMKQNNELFAIVMIPLNWLSDKDRQFPIIVDPEISIDVTDDVYLDVETPPLDTIGHQAFTKFPMNISDVTSIDKAYLILEATSVDDGGPVLIAYNCTNEWTESSSFATISGLPCTNTLNNTKVSGAGVFYWNVTDAVKGVFDSDSIVNITFRLNSTSNANTDKITNSGSLVAGDGNPFPAKPKATFASSETGGGQITPILNITYTASAPDSTPPTYWNQSQEMNNSNYSLTLEHEFNITWLDDTNVSAAWLDFNGTNLTATHRGSGVYNVSIIGIPASTQYFEWFSNDTSDNLNQKGKTNYTINKALSSINLTINGVASNATNLTNIAINISSFLLTGSQNISLYLDEILNQTSTSNFTIDAVFDSAGEKNITLIYEASSNFTRSSLTYFITISEPSSSSSSASTSSSNVGTSSAKACGDGICQPLMGETPLTCEADCGSADNTASQFLSKLRSYLFSAGKKIFPSYPEIGNIVVILLITYLIYFLRKNNFLTKFKKAIRKKR